MSIFSYNIVNQCIFISQGVELLLSTFLSGKINRLFVRKMSISYQNRKSRSWYPQWALSFEDQCLKGVFAKNERGQRLKPKNIPWWLLIFLLLSVCLKVENC